MRADGLPYHRGDSRILARRFSLTCLSITAGVLVSACTAREAPPPPAEPAVWDVVEDPRLTIGQVDGEDPAYSLHAVGDVRLLPDGGVVVRNGPTELRVFDQEGRYVTDVTRQGDGPTEVRYLGRVFTEGSLIRVVDSGRGRVLTFDLEGELSEGHSIAWNNLSGPAGLSVVGRLAFAMALDAPGLSDGTGESRRAVQLVRLEPDRTVDTLRTLPGPVLTYQGGAFYYTPLTSGSRIDPRPGGSVLTHATDPTLDFLDEKGRSDKVVDTGRRPEPLTQDVIDAYVSRKRDALAERGVNDPDLIFPFGREPDWPSHLPVYDRVYGASERCVWARRYQIPGDSIERYDVVSIEVGLVAEVTLPAGWRLRDIRGPEIAVLTLDEFDVPRVLVTSFDDEGDAYC